MPFHDEVNSGERFEFGANWTRFLQLVDQERIRLARTSLAEMLNLPSLEGLTFLDIGSGSGLFSLAAWQLGAQVRSFDYDPNSVACTQEMRRRFAGGDPGRWIIDRGSVLDASFMQALGEYDIVYSWGVLHHTGDLWRAVENSRHRIRSGGRFWLAIYNDQGMRSRLWLRIKRFYNQSPKWLRPGIVSTFYLAHFARQLLRARWLRNRSRPRLSYREQNRGMSLWRDMVDWIGGYPFEVAAPDAMLDFLRPRGFVLERVRTRGRGCNEYILWKLPLERDGLATPGTEWASAGGYGSSTPAGA